MKWVERKTAQDYEEEKNGTKCVNEIQTKMWKREKNEKERQRSERKKKEREKWIKYEKTEWRCKLGNEN